MDADVRKVKTTSSCVHKEFTENLNPTAQERNSPASTNCSYASIICHLFLQLTAMFHQLFTN